MRILHLFLFAFALLNCLDITGQKTYNTDSNFTIYTKHGPCSVKQFKYDDYHDVYFYNQENILVKKARYKPSFDIKWMVFDNELLFDTVVLYYPNGNIKAKIPYINGSKQGKEVYYFINGNVKHEKYYNRNKQEGLEIIKTENGDTLCLGQTQNSVKDGKFLICTLNGYNRIGVYQSNRLKRLQIIRDDNSKSSEYIFKDTLDYQIIDSVIIYDTINPSSNNVSSKFRFYPGYRNYKRNIKDSLLKDSVFEAPLKKFYYKKPKSDFIDFLENNLEYPEYCKLNGISGKVYIYFIVSREGHFIDIFAENNIAHADLKKEGIRVLKLLDGDFIQKYDRPCLGLIPLTFEISE
jgi:antitoxin component YwqK of YwqJK toxin-antitoxin module